VHCRAYEKFLELCSVHPRLGRSSILQKFVLEKDVRLFMFFVTSMYRLKSEKRIRKSLNVCCFLLRAYQDDKHNEFVFSILGVTLDVYS